MRGLVLGRLRCRPVPRDRLARPNAGECLQPPREQSSLLRRGPTRPGAGADGRTVARPRPWARTQRRRGCRTAGPRSPSGLYPGAHYRESDAAFGRPRTRGPRLLAVGPVEHTLFELRLTIAHGLRYSESVRESCPESEDSCTWLRWAPFSCVFAGFGADSAGSFCAWLHSSRTGRWQSVGKSGLRVGHPASLPYGRPRCSHSPQHRPRRPVPHREQAR